MGWTGKFAWNVNPENFKTELRTVFELLPHAADKKKLKSYVQDHHAHFSRLTEEECDALDLFIGMKKLGKKKRRAYLNDEGGYDMCTALTEIMEEGRKEGEGLLARLAQEMKKDGREAEFFACCKEEDLRERLLKEYGLN